MGKRLAPIAEQLMLSALSLLINIILIAASSKEDYGTFSVLNSYLILAVSIQTAIFSIPITVELTRENQIRRARSLIVSTWALIPVSVASALFGALLILIFNTSESTESNLILCSAFAFAIFGTWIREFSRTLYVLQNRLERSFVVSLVYSVTTTAGILYIYGKRNTLTTNEVFYCLGIASLLTSFDLASAFRKKIQLNELKNLFKLLGQHSKWAFPGVVTSWLQNSAYLTIVASLGGATVAAELSASRLFVMPYMTGFAGYCRTVVRKFSEELDNNPKKTIANALRIATIQVLIGLMLFGFFCLAETLKAGQYLGKYSSALPLAALWAIFAGVSSAKSVFSILAQAGRSFRALFIINVCAAVTVIAALYSPPIMALEYLSVCALILGETVSVALLWWGFKDKRESKYAK